MAFYVILDGKVKLLTCTEDGYDVYTCSCGETYTDTIAALGHDWGEWEVSVAGDCETDGTEVRSCSRCNATDERTVEATGHDWGDFVYDDEGHYQVCNNCGASSEKVAHDLVYTTSSRDHYHVGTCTCGYSVEDLHQAPSDTNSTCLCGKELSTDKFDYTFDSEKGGYLITQWASSMDDPNETELYLPSEHTGSEGTYPVVGIADGQSYESSMRDFYNLEFVAFPDSFIYIGNYAFANLSSLSVIAFSGNSNLETIGEYAFSYTKVNQAYLTSNHVSIGQYAFYTLGSQSSKISIVLGPYGHIGYGAFNEDDVTFFYRGTNDQRKVDLTLDDKTLSGADYVRYNLGEWEFIDGVATPTK